MILALSVFFIAGCGGLDYKESEKIAPEKYAAYSFDRFGDEVMPIGGYIGPTVGFGYNGTYMPSQITDYHFKQVKDCGLNFIIGMKPDYKTNAQDVIDALKFADKNDIMYFVRDTFLYDVTETNAANPETYTYVTLNEFQERVAAYKEYDSFAGLVGRDEPWVNMFPQLKNILEEYFYKTFDSNKLFYINSLSYQCPDGWFGSGPNGEYGADIDLEEYMEKWFESFPSLGYYSYDTYPFVGSDNYIRTDIFKNYSIARKFAEKNNVPFWTFMQCGGNWGGDTNWRVTNEAEMLWQVNTGLAYGAKGFTYFPYNTPPENINSPEGDDGLVGRAGQKTANWFYAQKANKQVAACDHILMKSKFKGIIHTVSGKEDTSNAVEVPELEKTMLNGKYREVVSITGDNAITGCFNYEGKTALYVVNNSITLDKAKVKINFNAKYKFDVIQRAQTVTAVGNTLELTFAPGEAACIVLY